LHGLFLPGWLFPPSLSSLSNQVALPPG